MSHDVRTGPSKDEPVDKLRKTAAPVKKTAGSAVKKPVTPVKKKPVSPKK